MNSTIDHVSKLVFKLQTNQTPSSPTSNTIETILDWDASYRCNPTQRMPLFASENAWFHTEHSDVERRQTQEFTAQTLHPHDAFANECDSLRVDDTKPTLDDTHDNFVHNLLLSYLERMHKAHSSVRTRSFFELQERVAPTIQYSFSLHGHMTDPFDLFIQQPSASQQASIAAAGPADTLPFFTNNLANTSLEALCKHKPHGVSTVWFGEWLRTIRHPIAPSTHSVKVDNLLRTLHFIVAFAIQQGESQLSNSLSTPVLDQSLIETIIPSHDCAQSLVWRMQSVVV